MKALEITGVVGCPNRCVYCPQDILLKNYIGERIFTLENYKRCINKLPKGIEIHFSGFGEAMINPQIIEILKYTREKGHKIWVFTTLRGLNIDKLNEMEGMEIDSFLIHLLNETEAKIVLDNNYYETLEYFLNGNFGKKVFKGDKMTPDKTIKLIEKYGYKVEKLELSGRGGLLDKYSHGCTKNKSIWCTREEQPVLMPNGDIVVCSNDYGLTGIFGNLLKQDLKEVEFSVKKKEFIKRMRKREIEMCNKCEWAQEYKPWSKLMFPVRVKIAEIIANNKKKSS